MIWLRKEFLNLRTYQEKPPKAEKEIEELKQNKNRTEYPRAVGNYRRHNIYIIYRRRRKKGTEQKFATMTENFPKLISETK